MSRRKTWIWIIVGAAGAMVLILVAIAGAGVYFVTQHIQARRSNNADALGAFDDVRHRFGDPEPLYDIDAHEGPRLRRPLDELPDSPVHPTRLCILGWNPDEQRLVRVVLPLWVVRLGHERMSVSSDDHGFELDRLNLDVDALRRIGPVLVVDAWDRQGSRVLIWTE